MPKLILYKLKAKYGDKLPLDESCDLRSPSNKAWNGTEHGLQRSFFMHLSKYLKDYPHLWLAHAIPNGGSRGKVEASKFKAEGVKAGIPDVFIPIPNFYYHGLYIEFKKKDGCPSEEQRAMILLLIEKGYQVIVVNDLETATFQFENYMLNIDNPFAK